MLTKLFYIIRLIPKIGFWNFFYMIWYRVSKMSGLRKRKFPVKELKTGVFYHPVDDLARGYKKEWKELLIQKADNILTGIYTWFSYHTYSIQKSPIWFLNPFDNSEIRKNSVHWLEMSDFDLEIGDVKIVWELSRFDWLTDLARAYRITGNIEYLNHLNYLLNDWCTHNPLNVGVNWKCGQEAGFRVMKMMTAAKLLGQYDKPSAVFKELVYAHLSRIEPNINYAIAQDNNHGTTESAALYIGAAWLQYVGYSEPKVKQWKTKGEKILRGRVMKLIQIDGSFAQRSMTYHRVVVDTMTWVIANQTLMNLPKWNDKVINRLEMLGQWQYKMTLGIDGDAPNYGSNDGANIGNLNSLDYRDFRGSTQAFFSVMSKARVYESQYVDESAYWYCGDEVFNFPIKEIETPTCEVLDNHILLMRKNDNTVFVKLPDTVFRPGTDAFHIDLWSKGRNILRDNGSYSYNAGKETDLFKSSAYHNTLKFLSHEQMPKLSRFLNAEWLSLGGTSLESVDDEYVWSGEYVDYKKCKHKREVRLGDKKLTITDWGAGGEFEVNYHLFEDVDLGKLMVSKEVDRTESTSFSSLYYLQKEEKPQLTFSNNSSITVTISLN